MPRGGPRPGSGRPRGSKTKRSQEIIAKAAAAGMLPHEFLCAVAQGHEVDGHKPTFAERMTAAQAAAPYYAPKLAALQHTGKDGAPIEHEHVVKEAPDKVKAEVRRIFGLPPVETAAEGAT